MGVAMGWLHRGGIWLHQGISEGEIVSHPLQDACRAPMEWSLPPMSDRYTVGSILLLGFYFLDLLSAVFYQRSARPAASARLRPGLVY